MIWRRVVRALAVLLVALVGFAAGAWVQGERLRADVCVTVLVMAEIYRDAATDVGQQAHLAWATMAERLDCREG